MRDLLTDRHDLREYKDGLSLCCEARITEFGFCSECEEHAEAVPFTDGSLGIVGADGIIRLQDASGTDESPDTDYVNTLIGNEKEYRETSFAMMPATLALMIVLTFAVAFASGFYTASAIAAEMVKEGLR